jgi:hypothetical protein
LGTSAVPPSARRRPPDPADSPKYAAVAVVGIVLFLVGIVIPVLAWAPDAAYVRLGVAALGGFLAMFGLIRWYDLRHGPRGRAPPPAPGKIAGLPSIEFFSPPRANEPTPPPGDEARSYLVAGRAGWHMAQRSHGGAALSTVVIVAVLSMLVVSGGPAPSLASPSTQVAAAVASSSPTVSTGATPNPLAGVVPVCNPPLYPVYTPLHGLNPPLPMYSRQSPCKVPHDEVHATFSSTVPGSGEQFEVPVRIPTDGDPGQSAVYGDFYVGMVVQGNPSSEYGQSYAAVVFSPLGFAPNIRWNVTVAVWSMVLNTTCPLTSKGLPSGFNLTYSHSYACVIDETGHGDGTNLATGVPGGQQANVTMSGSATSAAHPLEVWFNDSTNSSYSSSFVLSAVNTFTDEYRPYYVSACPDRCLLNWSMPFGLGVGIDLCDTGSCFSYNQSALLGDPPFEVGAPEYWTGLAYSGNYLYFSPESSTGACSGAGSVSPCDPTALAGYYPFFSFNGTVLNFGANWTWATQDWGGAAFQFNGFGTLTDFVPLFIDQYTNSSRAGYIAPGSALNVSARVQDLGRVASVNLSYTQPGGSLVNETISRISGTVSSGVYAGAIPATGSNGTISFRVVATNAALGVVALPSFLTGPSTVVRARIPTFNLTLLISPPGCGGVSVNGSAIEPNGTVRALLAGTYPIRTASCYPYVFDRWTTAGGASVMGSTASAGVLLDGNGTVTAGWTYVRPYDGVGLTWSPAGCGAIVLNGKEFLASGGPQVDELLNDSAYSLGETTCGGHAFSGWVVSNPENLTVLGPSVTVRGNGTIEESSVTASSSLPIIFETNPSNCGGVLVNGAAYTSGESIDILSGTPYPVGPDPCAGYGYNGTFSTSANITIAGGELTATQGGTVTFEYYKLTLVTILTTPAGCGEVGWDGVLEPSGAVLNVTNHTLHTISADACPDHYLQGWDVTGGLSRAGLTLDVNGPGTVEAVYRSGTPEAAVEFITEPAGCGSVDFGGTQYVNTEGTVVTPGAVVSVGAVPCTGYGFVKWVPSGGIALTATGSTAYVNYSGSIEAVFHGLVSVHLSTSPAACGSIVLAGTVYVNGAAPNLPVDNVYPIQAVPCLHETLQSWEVSTGATIANGTLILEGSALIAAIFVPAVYGVTLLVQADACGAVSVNGVQYANNSTLNLTAGAYPIAPAFCAGYGLSGWTTTGGLNVSGTSLLVGGSGTVVADGAAVFPSVSLAVPSSAAAGLAFLLTATVAVPVPPYNYNFTWSFGDGTMLSTPTNFTSHTYASTGTYLVSVTVTDPLGRMASAEANVTIVPASTAPSFQVGVTGLMVIGLAVVVLAAAAIVAVMMRRRSGGSEPLDRPPGATVDADAGTEEPVTGPGGGYP